MRPFSKGNGLGGMGTFCNLRGEQLTASCGHYGFSHQHCYDVLYLNV